ncbi:unnamed protein product [Triticum turgidum subsp. durum]|uniref:Sulfotransferase n=1 Tax=Triticum turgidum subsp. durum TaxID=4567 RepID=A0A9R1NW79_TRITD|nr:unnamed protein product [Triticum turgidum subsp. durum]
MSRATHDMDGNAAPDAYARYEAIASSLPTSACQGLGAAAYKNHRGFWYPAHQMSPTLAARDTFVARPTDILVATLPKSGTTWLKALVFAVAYRRTHTPALEDGAGQRRHPLLGSSPHDLVPFLHYVYEKHRSAAAPLLEAMPAPRVLAVHAPLSALPASVAGSGCRVVYMCRDPKDALVSLWHYLRKANRPGATAASLEELLAAFCDGVSPFGPAWEHVAEYWRESLARPEQVMFLRYEHVKEDTVGSVKRLAEFLGCPFTAEEAAGGVPEAVAALCGIERMRSVEANRTGEYGVHWKFSNSAFFRNGEVGDWKQHMTAEMAQRIDGIMDGSPIVVVFCNLLKNPQKHLVK